MLLGISSLLGILGCFPAYRAERQLTSYKKHLLTLTPKQRQKAEPFFPKSNILFWRFFAAVFAVGLFVGAIKYTKDNLNQIKIGNQDTKLSNVINELDSIKPYYTRLLDNQHKNDININYNNIKRFEIILNKIKLSLKEKHQYLDENYNVKGAGIYVKDNYVMGSGRDGIHFETNINTKEQKKKQPEL